MIIIWVSNLWTPNEIFSPKKGTGMQMKLIEDVFPLLSHNKKKTENKENKENKE